MKFLFRLISLAAACMSSIRLRLPALPPIAMADLRAILSTLVDCLSSVVHFLSKIVYLLWWPASKLVSAAQALLSPIWALLHFIFLPVIHLGNAILTLLLLPFRLQLLDRFEAIYIWLGIAGLIGCVAGAVAFIVFHIITSALSIDEATQSKKRAEGRTVQEYRASRTQRKESKDVSSGSAAGPVVARLATPRRRGISSQAIMEEESEL